MTDDQVSGPHQTAPQSQDPISTWGRAVTPRSSWSGVATRALTLSAAGAAIALLSTAVRKYRNEVRLGDFKLVELSAWQPRPRLLTEQYEALARHTLRWDFVLIAGYSAAMLLGLTLAWYLVSPSARRWIGFGAFAAGVTALADCLENLLLLRAIAGRPTLLWLDGYDLASAFAVVKFCALIPAAGMAMLGVGLGVIRGLTFPHRGLLTPAEGKRPLPILCTDQADHADDAAEAGRQARWRRGYAVPACAHPRPAPTGSETTGICLSGGGVRAASVALGVLQAERFRTQVVPHAQYLVSVSGGGYTAGAFAQALTSAQPLDLPAGHQVVRDPASAFLVGSPEEDHLRRHSSYIADSPVHMLTALGLLAGHLLQTLTLLFSPAILLGVAAGLFYHHVPITELRQPARGQSGQLELVLRNPTWWSLGVIGALTVLCYLAMQFNAAHPRTRSLHRPISALAHALLGLSAVIAGLTVALPCVIWTSSWLLHRSQGGLQVASPIAVVLLTYVTSLTSLAWRRRSLLKKKSSRRGPTVAPRGMVQIVLVMASFIVLVLGWLLLFGAMATVGLADSLSWADWGILLALLATLLLLGVLTDETTLSLHPFYRERLASAFAVRRVRRKDGQTVAQPYDPAERTSLSTHGVLATPTEFPHVIFAASATLGEQRTAPGYGRVSYTFCSDWVGGPDVGYVDTRKLEELAPSRLRRDLTVQGAVALSGAAIAASTGGQRSSWYEPLLVVSGVRLGAWMPNPTFMIDRYATARSVTRVGLPRARRMNYLLQELFGLHPADGPLLQVTDGGFYDNLGLLELFRRGCTRIYCVDASGDGPPAALTLAQALTRAYQELGVRTDLDESTWSTATAGSGQKLSPEDPLAALSQRLSATGVITGTFRYPSCGPSAGRSGTLVVAKAALWDALPYSLMAYAQGATVFPHDSTADQWFDDRQYAAYTELGRCLGEAAAAAMQSLISDAASEEPDSAGGREPCDPAWSNGNTPAASARDNGQLTPAVS